MKASVLTDLKRFAEAESILEGLVDRDSVEPYPWMNLAFVSFAEGDYSKTESRLRHAIDLAEIRVAEGQAPYCHPLRELAVVYHLQGNPKANGTIDRALRCSEPDLPWFNLVKGRFLLGSPDRSIEAAEQLAVADARAKPQDPLVKQYLALARLRTGQPEKAIAEAKLSIELGGDVTFNSLVLAIAYHHTGDHAGATDMRARAEQAWPAVLREEGAIRRRRPQGIFWYDSANEYLALSREADQLIRTTKD